MERGLSYYIKFNVQCLCLQGVPQKMVHLPAATVKLMHHFLWDTLYVYLYDNESICPSIISCRSEQLLSTSNRQIQNLDLQTFSVEAFSTALFLTLMIFDLLCSSEESVTEKF